MSGETDVASDPVRMPRVAVAIVHYRSAGMLLDLLADLGTQRDVDLEIHVVESGDDGTLARVEAEFPGVRLHRPGRNMGYASGNNLVFGQILSDPDSPPTVLVVNPDVRVTAPTTVGALVAALAAAPAAAAAAPVIRDEAGRIEYLSSLVDRRRAVAIHTDTWVEAWPDGEATRSIEWLDGACLVLRRAALAELGGFDERYFLIVEEVDWCLRARNAGWDLILARDAEIAHQRSSSFEGSTKSAYYSARNHYLLFKEHGRGSTWRWWWAVGSLRTAASKRSRRSGASRSVLRGMLDALRGRTGPAPEDS